MQGREKSLKNQMINLLTKLSSPSRKDSFNDALFHIRLQNDGRDGGSGYNDDVNDDDDDGDNDYDGDSDYMMAIVSCLYFLQCRAVSKCSVRIF
jgi:hypothetical protein